MAAAEMSRATLAMGTWHSKGKWRASLDFLGAYDFEDSVHARYRWSNSPTPPSLGDNGRTHFTFPEKRTNKRTSAFLAALARANIRRVACQYKKLSRANNSPHNLNPQSPTTSLHTIFSKPTCYTASNQIPQQRSSNFTFTFKKLIKVTPEVYPWSWSWFLRQVE